MHNVEPIEYAKIYIYVQFLLLSFFSFLFCFVFFIKTETVKKYEDKKNVSHQKLNISRLLLLIHTTANNIIRIL